MGVLKLAVLLGLVVSVVIAKEQRIKVKGRLFCGNQPAANVRVKLIEEDSGFNPDDDLDSKDTDANGRFELDGAEDEFGDIEPYLKIYHDCNDGVTPCQRKWKIGIPAKYANKGVFDFGEVNLEAMMNNDDSGESHDCDH